MAVRYTSSGPPTCHRCNRVGHMARECNLQTCFRCNSRGHMAWECADGMTCSLCNEKGHLQRNCKNVSCHKCGRKGHISKYCNDPFAKAREAEKQERLALQSARSQTQFPPPPLRPTTTRDRAVVTDAPEVLEDRSRALRASSSANGGGHSSGESNGAPTTTVSQGRKERRRDSKQANDVLASWGAKKRAHEGEGAQRAILSQRVRVVISAARAGGSASALRNSTLENPKSRPGMHTEGKSNAPIVKQEVKEEGSKDALGTAGREGEGGESLAKLEGVVMGGSGVGVDSEVRRSDNDGVPKRLKVLGGESEGEGRREGLPWVGLMDYGSEDDDEVDDGGEERRIVTRN